MHTVFINTTEKESNAINYTAGAAQKGDSAGLDVLKYEIQQKKLKYVNCPLKTWNNEKIGYNSVVREVSRYIDTYNNVDNDFNLIVYVDMCEVAAYMDISLNESNEDRKAAIFDTYIEMTTRLITETVYKGFCDVGREPSFKFLLLLERPLYTAPQDIKNPNGAEYSVYELERINIVFEFLGIIDYPELVAKIENIKKSGGKCTVDDILKDKKLPADISFKDVYLRQINTLLKGLIESPINIQRQCVDFCNTISTLYSADVNNYVGISEYYTNRSILGINFDAARKRSFLLQSFIWECVNTQSLFTKTEGLNGAVIYEPKRIRELSSQQWDEICTLLARKKKGLEKQRLTIENNQKNYIDQRLAPPLYDVDFEKFGIDESGHLMFKLIAQNNNSKSTADDGAKGKKDKKDKKEEKDKKSKGKKKDTDQNSDENDAVESEIRGRVQKQELVEKEIPVTSRLTDDSTYDYYVEPTDVTLPYEPNATNINEFLDSSLNLANKSISIVGDLSRRIGKNMSHYSAPSDANDPPILRKRHVSFDGESQVISKNDYVYAVRDSGGEPQRSEYPVEVLGPSAPVAYKTLAVECLEFDSLRGIEIGNVEKECVEFREKIENIKACMASTMRVSAIVGGIFAALFLIPFVGSQYKGIFANFNTLIVALLSLLIPFAFMGFGYIVAKQRLKKDVKEEWEKLTEAYKRVNYDNHSAIKAYDDLLTSYIPSLRWIYEYLLDIDFHLDCLSTARARFGHHKSVLRSTSETIDIILKDLNFDDSSVPAPVLNEEDYVDCSTSPYEGDNYQKYSILDQNIIKAIFG